MLRLRPATTYNHRWWVCISDSSAYTDDRNTLYVYIYGFYLNFMDSGISPENLPLYKGKSAEDGKGSFCLWRSYAFPPRSRWLLLNLW